MKYKFETNQDLGITYFEIYNREDKLIIDSIDPQLEFGGITIQLDKEDIDNLILSLTSIRNEIRNWEKENL
ncbi:MAG: hypothetical protein KDC73_06615 [Ignavibacteriae bacterium]|nr:hypothetical protein [Ignavibacteriota bacterium]MCB9243597.1 hypothetical protein [Ignavibacteriales bacterium]